MPTISDLLKEAIWLKAVPNSAPNSEGEWVMRSVSTHRISPRTHWNYLTSILPPGHHCVAVSRDRPKIN